MGHIPSGMEAFPAADVEQFEYIKKIIDECDYYVLIVAGRYGSLDTTGISFTEKEYRYAVSQKRTVLAFIHNDLGNIPAGKTDLDSNLREKLKAFRSEIGTGRLVQFWTNREELRSKVIISLHKAMSEYPGVGWMRGNAAASEDLLAQINRLRLENDDLRSKMVAPFEGKDSLADLKSTFLIHYTYKEWNSRLSEFKELRATVTVSWETLFLLLYRQFVTPRKDIVSSLLCSALQEKKLIPATREEPRIFTTDLQTIQAQLHAYGFIAPEVGGESKDGNLQVTSLGERRYLELATIKVDQDNNWQAQE